MDDQSTQSPPAAQSGVVGSQRLLCAAPPARIWLQWHGDQKPEDCDGEPSEVTWCQDRMFVADVQYVRADKVSRLVNVAERLIGAFEFCASKHPDGRNDPWLIEAREALRDFQQCAEEK